MEYFKCAFAGALMSNKQITCTCAVEVTRREGPSMGCICTDAHQYCADTFSNLKKHAIDKFEVEDDLTEMPHSVIMKIQQGGLFGLSRLLDEDNSRDGIEDIRQLMINVDHNFGGIHNIPYEKTIDDIINFKLRRRRKA